MKYRKNRSNDDISILGYGCMRFSRKNGSIDIDKAEREILSAIDGGVNYFDTAYIYPGSEVALGEILNRNKCRDKVNIATKLPHYMIKSRESLDKCFNQQLKRLQTDYLDYYLIHILTDVDTWDRLKKLGIEEWIGEKKSAGLIRNIGFSYHGNSDMFLKLIDVYPWDFCQIQYNYMDENSQAGKRGLLYAGNKGIPVVIMEPLRGGRLVNMLPESAEKLFALDERRRTPAEWAFRWLWNQKEVTCVLSGMNSIEMVEENIRVASVVEENEFSDEDYALVESVKNEINKKTKVGCTGCGYCLPCPHGVDIPLAFRCYNEIYLENKKTARKEYMQCTVLRAKTSSASQCVDCGKCEKHCPQFIEIRKELKACVNELESPFYKIAKKIIGILKLW